MAVVDRRTDFEGLSEAWVSSASRGGSDSGKISFARNCTSVIELWSSGRLPLPIVCIMSLPPG